MKVFSCAFGLFLIIPVIAFADGTWSDTSFVPPSLGFERWMRIYLPEGYDPGGSIDYPVIYWLHAWGATYTQDSWSTKFALDSLISSQQIQPVIVVKPDGWCQPYNGCMWVNSELYGDYEDFVVYDLVNFIESSFCVVSDPEYRCIAGHSMGAGGSMRIALEHTDRYKAVASHAGFQDLQVALPLFVTEVLEECPESEPPYTYDWGNGSYTDALFLSAGGYSPNLNAPDSVDFVLDENGMIIDSVYALWELFNPAHMVKEISPPIGLDIFIDCGINDEWAGVYACNCSYSDTLAALGIDHVFQSLESTTHQMNIHRFIQEFLFLGEAMTGIEIASELQAGVLLEPAFPNPFSGSTTFCFQLMEPGRTVLQVFDLSGRLVETLLDGELQKGYHTVVFNAEDCCPGIYLYRLQSGSSVQIQRCIML
ncbi:MAG: T9SS type A sorting domain-containing protein [Candidatus Aegiribacteria sp.]|nr:T9SS type A sorting domain-containing protein [Candidatus Aegiribacteria sp.]